MFNGWDEALQVVFHDIVISTCPHGGYSRVFSNRPGGEDEGNFRVILTDLRQRCSSAKAREGKVAEEDIPSTFCGGGGKRSRRVGFLELDPISRLGQHPCH